MLDSEVWDSGLRNLEVGTHERGGKLIATSLNLLQQYVLDQIVKVKRLRLKETPKTLELQSQYQMAVSL